MGIAEGTASSGCGLPDPAADAASSFPLTAAAAPGPTTLSELIADYFEHLYPLPPYFFLHEPTALERCRNTTPDAPLKLALCAI